MNTISAIAGETKIVKYQLKENKVPKDITNLSFKLGVKSSASSTDYLIGPIDGEIVDALAGQFSFEITIPDESFTAVFEVAMYDQSGKKVVLSAPEGVEFKVYNKIIE